MLPLNFETTETPTHARANMYASWVLGDALEGVVTQQGMVTVIVEERPTSAQVAALRDSFTREEHVLVVTSDKATLLPDGTDTATILCNHPILASDGTVRYEVRYTGSINGVQSENEMYASGTAPVESGVVALTLTVDFAGEYRVLIRRNAPSYHFGGIVITATEG